MSLAPQVQPATVLSPTPKLRGHLPALDGVRGLAVLMVMLFHFIVVGGAPSLGERVFDRVIGFGVYGVELFFILSGFLITGILYDTCNAPNYFRNFYMRRCLRIFPLYYGVLALVFFVAPLIPLLRGPALDYLVDRQAWAWLYGVNVYIARNGDWTFSYLNHFWSLAVEEHFYFFWPLLVFMLAGRPRTLLLVSLGGSLGAMLARLVGVLLGLSWWTTYVFTPFRLDALTLGAFIAVMVRQPWGLDRLTRNLPRLIVVTGVLLVISFVWTRLITRAGLELVLPVRAGLIEILLACLLVWVLIAPGRSITSRFFCSRTMVFLGTYSYGLYVYHHFISFYLASNHIDEQLAPRFGSHFAAVAVLATLGFSASLVLAYLSYELFEKRFLRMKRLFETAKQPEPEPELTGVESPSGIAGG